MMRRFTRRVLALGLLLLAGGSVMVTHPVDAQQGAGCEEAVPPALAAFDFQARAVNVQTGPAVVNLTAHATDDSSGVRAVSAHFKSPTGADRASASLAMPAAASGTAPALATDLTGTMTIRQFVEPGTWTVESVNVVDTAGNSKLYTPSAEWNPAWPTDLAVASDPDVTPPAVSAFDIQPRVANTTAAPAELTVTAQATDTGAGVNYAFAHLTSPSGDDSVGVSMFPDAGTMTGTLRIGQWVEPGLWKVASLTVLDRVGNARNYTPASEWGAGWPTDIQVISNHDDDPPDLASFSFSPQSVDTSLGEASVTVTAQATDSVSGASHAHVSFVSPSGAQAAHGTLGVSQDGGPLGATLSGVVRVPQYAEAGTWKVASVSLVDRAGNGASFSPASPEWAPVVWPTDLSVTSAEAPPPAAAPNAPPPPSTCPAAVVAAAGDVLPTVAGVRVPRLPVVGTPAVPPAPPAPGTGGPGGNAGGGAASAPASPPDVPTPLAGTELDRFDTGRSRFAASIPTPGDVSLDLDLLATNALLAAIAVLLVAFPAELFNKTIEENRDTIRTWPWIIALGRTFGGARDAVRRISVGRGALVTMLLSAGLLYSFLDSNFPGGFKLAVADVVGMAAAVWAVTVVYEFGAGWFAGRWYGERGSLVLSPGVLLVAVGCVVLSRVADFQPGYLYGLIAGVDFAGRLSHEDEGKAIGGAAALLLGVGVLAWILWIPIGHAAGPGANVLTLMADTALAAIFVAAIEALIFGLIPLRYLDGDKVKAWSTRGWLAIYGVGMFLFFQVLVRPAPGHETSAETSWVTVIGLAAAFGAASVGLWAYFRYFSPEPPEPIDLDAPDRVAGHVETFSDTLTDLDRATREGAGGGLSSAGTATAVRGEVDLLDPLLEDGLEDGDPDVAPEPVRRPRAIAVRPGGKASGRGSRSSSRRFR